MVSTHGRVKARCGVPVLCSCTEPAAWYGGARSDKDAATGIASTQKSAKAYERDCFRREAIASRALPQTTALATKQS